MSLDNNTSPICIIGDISFTYFLLYELDELDESFRLNPFDLRLNPLDLRLNPLDLRLNPLDLRLNPLDLSLPLDRFNAVLFEIGVALGEVVVTEPSATVG